MADDRRTAAFIGRALAVLVGLLAVLLCASAATTAVDATAYAYDAPAIARVGVHQIGDLEAGSFQLSVVREGSASPPAAARGTSTTPHARSVATEAAVDTTDALPGYRSFRAAKADLGSPGASNVYDHVVEQSQIGRSGFAPEEIHSPFNLDPVDAGINQAKANYYSSIRPFTGGQTVRDWLTGQTFAEQHAFGMRVNGLLQSGVPLP